MIDYKTLTLRNLIIRDYSVIRDELFKRDKMLFDKFVKLEYLVDNYNFNSCILLLNELDDFLYNELKSNSQKSKILNYISKL